jgi:hypothetical protein
MTFVGKLLVILQLVLSVCFMFLAGAVFTRHEQWQTKYKEIMDEGGTMEQVEDERDKAVAELTAIEERLEAKVKNLEDDLGTAKSRADEMQRERDELIEDKNLLQTELNTQESVAQIAAAEAENRRDEALLRLEQNKVLNVKVNEQDAIIQQQEDELFNREVERRTIVTRYTELLENVAIYRKVLAANGFDTDPKTYARKAVPTPLVYGEVVETRKSARAGRELVQVSIGSDDGIKEGTTLFVYRIGERNRYLGEITVTLVRPDMAVGVVVSKAKNGVIEAKDYVTTRL